MPGPTPEELQALADLGTTPEQLRACTRAPTLEAARAQLDALKREAKRRFRRLSLELHPDVNGGDPAKTERFRVLLAVWRQLEEVQLQARQAPPPVVYRPGVVVQGWSTTASTGTTSTSSGFGKVNYTVFYRRT